MNPRVLSKSAWAVVHRLDQAGLLDGWVLAGGTGLALQLGHRVSEDLDLFTHGSFDASALRVALASCGKLELQSQATDTLHTRLDGVRLSYLRSEAPFLYPCIEYRGLCLADARDIAAMKIIAVAGRGSRKDFVDLHAYLEGGGDFRTLMEIVHRRYSGTTFNEVHLLRSLVYFEDAEQEPMPKMLRSVDWGQIMQRIEEEVRRWTP